MSDALTFVVVGDSAASGVGDSDANGNYYGWGYHLAHAFEEPLVYINASRPGAQSKEVLHEQLPKVLIHQPDLVAVIVGGNDLLRNAFSPIKFEENLRKILGEIEQIGATSLLLELHDPTQIVLMPRLLARICNRRVTAVNKITRELADRYGSVLLQTRNMSDIYSRDKWHVDRMHPSRVGHQHIAAGFQRLLINRGYEVGDVLITAENNRSRLDSIGWLLRNGAPWLFKRSFDLLPSLLFLMLIECTHFLKKSNTLVERKEESYLAPVS
jgi:lysophospholipase L1-like esterase